MGVDISAWRARIGTFTQPFSWRCVDVSTSVYDPGDSGVELCYRLLFQVMVLQMVYWGRPVINYGSESYIQGMELIYGFSMHPLSEGNMYSDQTFEFPAGFTPPILMNNTGINMMNSSGMHAMDQFYVYNMVTMRFCMGSGMDTITQHPLEFTRKLLILANDIETHPGPGSEFATKADITAINGRLDEVLAGINHMKAQWDSMSDKLLTLQASVSDIEQKSKDNQVKIDKIGFMEEDLRKTKEELKNSIENTKKLNQSIDELEDRNRRNNLIFFGIAQEQNETWEQTEQKVRDVIRDKMNLNSEFEIERAHRIYNGPSSRANGSKPIIVTFSRFKDRANVQKNSYKLKGSDIFVNEDYCKNTRRIQKLLRERQKEIKDHVKKADVRYKKLVVVDNSDQKSEFVFDEDSNEIVSL